MEVKLSLFLIKPYENIKGNSGVFLTLISGHLHAQAASQGKNSHCPLNKWLGGTENKFGFKEKNFLPLLGIGVWFLSCQTCSLVAVFTVLSYVNQMKEEEMTQQMKLMGASSGEKSLYVVG